MLGERVTLSRAGTNVQLTITSLCLRLSDLDSGRVIHQHEMPNISFALPPTQPVQGLAHRAQLSKEEWFHGPISRKDAEQLLRHDGDFLVRESQGSPGQYVLTGMQGQGRKHLLLVDPEGVVRTRDRSFDSVTHLIDFHRNNKLPIISAESALRLETPVRKVRR